MLGAGALGQFRGMVRGGRREEGSGWGTRVYLWWIHVNTWQNQYNIVKLKKKSEKVLAKWLDIKSIYRSQLHSHTPVTNNKHFKALYNIVIGKYQLYRTNNVHEFYCENHKPSKKKIKDLRWLSGKESTCNAGDAGLIPGSGRSPGEVNGNPFQYSHPGNLMDRGAWQVTAHGVAKELDMT